MLIKIGYTLIVNGKYLIVIFLSMVLRGMRHVKKIQCEEL